jgi:hypothetical protein
VAHFPAAIPAEATGVQIRATGVDGWFPSPDYSLTVRMVLPLDRAVAISTDAAARQVPARWSDTGTAPPGSTRYVLVNPGLTTSWGGVTVNPATGEVIYWCEKF